MLLDQKNAVVTGTNRSIGKMVALRFSEEGANEEFRVATCAKSCKNG